MLTGRPASPPDRAGPWPVVLAVLLAALLAGVAGGYLLDTVVSPVR